MPKKSIINRQKLKEKTVKKYINLRKILIENFRKSSNIDEKQKIHFKIQKLPRNSSQVRLKNRCWKTGKARGFIRYFGLCRNIMRKFAHDGFLPGVIKSSW